MTLYRRIKDYCDRRKAHYHLERIALPSDEPTEDDLRGEDMEVIKMNVKYQSQGQLKDLGVQMGDVNEDRQSLTIPKVTTSLPDTHLGIGAMTKEDIKRLEGKV